MYRNRPPNSLGRENSAIFWVQKYYNNSLQSVLLNYSFSKMASRVPPDKRVLIYNKILVYVAIGLELI